MKRTPLPARTKPLPRSTKPIRKRSPKTAGVRAKDRVWGALVRGGAGGRCEKSGSAGNGWPLDPHHIWGKQAFPRLRHEPVNGCCLARDQHRWAHENPKEFREWFAETFEDRWAELNRLKEEAQ